MGVGVKKKIERKNLGGAKKNKKQFLFKSNINNLKILHKQNNSGIFE